MHILQPLTEGEMEKAEIIKGRSDEEVSQLKDLANWTDEELDAYLENLQIVLAQIKPMAPGTQEETEKKEQKAASQTDEAETKLFLLKQEFDAYKQQNKWGSDEEVSQLKDLLQEEKRKNDDFQFFLEELEIEVSQLNKELLQEQKRCENFESKAEKQLIVKQLEEAKGQSVFLKDQMGNMKVESDLQIQKIKMEFEVEMNNLTGALDQKSALVDKLKDDLGNKESELEFVKEDLQNKKEELEDIASDLEIMEASFDNELKNVEEKHREEVSILKVTIARQT